MPSSGVLTISRSPRFGPGGPPQRTRINHLIRITPIRVIGADGEQIGVIETSQAIKMAESQGFDLVEISPDARPPVCKIMDYGKFKYELSKEDKNKGAKASELKEVRLGRSVKIDPHDVEIRVNQARKFLLDGHKVLITQRFKGREMAHRELGVNRLRQIRDTLADIAKCESEPRWMGPQASIIMAPEKAKVDVYRRKHGMDKPPAHLKKDKDKDKDKPKREGTGPAAGKPAPGVGDPPAPAKGPVESLNVTIPNAAAPVASSTLAGAPVTGGSVPQTPNNGIPATGDLAKA